MSSFKEKVIEVVKQIPKGHTLTYGEVAGLAGNPRAARAVGNIMRNNKDITIACHRVVRADGKCGGHNGLRGNCKASLLEEEKKLQSIK